MQFLQQRALFSYAALTPDKDRQHTMSDQKSHQFRPPLFNRDGDAAPSQRSAPNGNEQNGWDAYRKWLTRVGTKGTGERAPLDHSIYSWRGYHTWADKVKQTWKSES